LRERVESHLAGASVEARTQAVYDIPTFFERKKVEEQLRDALVRAEAANKAKSIFLANMSHEIRTPLNGVLGIANLLQRQELGEDQRKLVDTIDESGKALLTILNDILDLSKIEAGMLAMSVSPCDVRGVLLEVESLLFARIQEKGLSFTVEIDDAVPPLVGGDCMRLRQVVLNLAGNAVKFTEQGSIVLRASWDADLGILRVAVQDTGVGIPVGEVARLFENFTQAESSSSRSQGGTGLGLSISRQLVQLMGGEIDVESEVGVGSTFWLEVPASPFEPDGEETKERGPSADRRFNGAKVLVVEDNRINRLVAERLFQGWGCQVTAVHNGQEAVDVLAEAGFDLVFMDCQMPVMDGFEATRRIREQERAGQRTPIVAMTASVMQGDSERCLAAGMDGFLGKPIDPTQIQAVLGRFLAESATSAPESTES
jgi:signal transduction histidine kinase/CheY-like chemotaxis protein